MSQRVKTENVALANNGHLTQEVLADNGSRRLAVDQAGDKHDFDCEMALR